MTAARGGVTGPRIRGDVTAAADPPPQSSTPAAARDRRAGPWGAAARQRGASLDRRTTGGIAEKAWEHLPAAELYAATGRQHAPCTALLQFVAAREAGQLGFAERASLIPDLLTCRLTDELGGAATAARGRRRCASTPPVAHHARVRCVHPMIDERNQRCVSPCS
ncbi:hypothetical protein [Streptomyces alfalfae]